VDYTGESLKHGLDAPETSATKTCRLFFGHEDWMRRGQEGSSWRLSGFSLPAIPRKLGVAKRPSGR